MKRTENKLENEFRDKLNGREIEPAAASWDRLDAMLSVAESKAETKQKPVVSLNWLYIAAGFLALLFLGTMVFNDVESAKDNEVIVQEEVLAPTPVEPIAPEIQTNEGSIAEKSENQNVIQKRTAKSTSIVKFSNSDIAERSTQLKPEIEQSHQSSTNNSITESVNDAGVNQMLASAADESPERAKPRVTVDAKLLLNQVDGELNQRYRETTLDKMRKKYNNVKVALSNRNNQQ